MKVTKTVYKYTDVFFKDNNAKNKKIQKTTFWTKKAGSGFRK